MTLDVIPDLKNTNIYICDRESCLSQIPAYTIIKLDIPSAGMTIICYPGDSRDLNLQFYNA